MSFARKVARKQSNRNHGMSTWRDIIGARYESGQKKPEELVMIDLDLATEIGFGMLVMLAPDHEDVRNKSESGHVFLVVKYDGWVERWRQMGYGPVVDLMMSMRRDGCSIAIQPLEAPSTTPGGFGEVSWKIGLIEPDPTKKADWLPGHVPVEVHTVGEEVAP
jgi:hypothetical protein